jgi:ABC-type transport system involved in multi-copper enzyme maturation permease subunit
MTSLFPHDKEEKRQLTAVWLYFLFGGDSALFNISAIMNGSASMKLLCLNPLTKNIAKPQNVGGHDKKTTQ